MLKNPSRFVIAFCCFSVPFVSEAAKQPSDQPTSFLQSLACTQALAPRDALGALIQEIESAYPTSALEAQELAAKLRLIANEVLITHTLDNEPRLLKAFGLAKRLDDFAIHNASLSPTFLAKIPIFDHRASSPFAEGSNDWGTSQVFNRARVKIYPVYMVDTRSSDYSSDPVAHIVFVTVEPKREYQGHFLFHPRAHDVILPNHKIRLRRVYFSQLLEVHKKEIIQMRNSLPMNSKSKTVTFTFLADPTFYGLVNDGSDENRVDPSRFRTYAKDCFIFSPEFLLRALIDVLNPQGDAG